MSDQQSSPPPPEAQQTAPGEPRQVRADAVKPGQQVAVTANFQLNGGRAPALAVAEAAAWMPVTEAKTYASIADDPSEPGITYLTGPGWAGQMATPDHYLLLVRDPAPAVDCEHGVTYDYGNQCTACIEDALKPDPEPETASEDCCDGEVEHTDDCPVGGVDGGSVNPQPEPGAAPLTAPSSVPPPEGTTVQLVRAADVHLDDLIAFVDCDGRDWACDLDEHPALPNDTLQTVAWRAVVEQPITAGSFTRLTIGGDDARSLSMGYGVRLIVARPTTPDDAAPATQPAEPVSDDELADMWTAPLDLPAITTELTAITATTILGNHRERDDALNRAAGLAMRLVDELGVTRQQRDWALAPTAESGGPLVVTEDDAHAALDQPADPATVLAAARWWRGAWEAQCAELDNLSDRSADRSAVDQQAIVAQARSLGERQAEVDTLRAELERLHASEDLLQATVTRLGRQIAERGDGDGQPFGAPRTEWRAEGGMEVAAGLYEVARRLAPLALGQVTAHLAFMPDSRAEVDAIGDAIGDALDARPGHMNSSSKSETIYVRAAHGNQWGLSIRTHHSLSGDELEQVRAELVKRAGQQDGGGSDA